MNKNFTIIIPCFNTEKYIAKSLESLINQNYDISLLQIIVVDDGSHTKNIEHIVRKYQKDYPNIEYFYKNNNNWGSVINYVIENKLAKNDYVSILDSDDFLHKNYFKIINNKIKDNDVFIGAFRKWNGKRPVQYICPYYFIFKRTLKNKYQKETPISIPIVFCYKKELFYMTKKLEEGISYQDGNYISQILLNSKKIIFTYKVLAFYYSNREGNSINQAWDKKRFDAELANCKNFIDNDLQELVAFRFNLKEFKNMCKENNVKFDVKRKMKFSWLPCKLEWIYIIIFYILHKKYFNFK